MLTIDITKAALAVMLAGCSATTSTPTPQPEPTAAGYTAADVAFMQTMIGHHAQALVMTELVPARTSTPELHALAERITISQRDEIERMQSWLRRRNQPVPPADAHVHAAMGHAVLMPGMLTQAQLDSLAQARGPQFDRLFLQYMIRHHEGAIEMVRQLLAQPGAGQEPETFIFASEVDADQNAEIRRMRALLTEARN